MKNSVTPETPPGSPEWFALEVDNLNAQAEERREMSFTTIPAVPSSDMLLEIGDALRRGDSPITIYRIIYATALIETP